MVGSIIARQSELAALDDFLAGIAEGPQALFFEGEAGIGKTRLWREGLDRARARDVRVLATRPGGAEVQLAFAGIADLLHDVLDRVLGELPPPQRRALAIALLVEDPDGAPPDDRAVGAAFLAALRMVAADGPVLARCGRRAVAGRARRSGRSSSRSAASTTSSSPSSERSASHPRRPSRSSCSARCLTSGSPVCRSARSASAPSMS